MAGLFVAVKPDLISALSVIAYASNVGIKDILPLEKLHVTVMYSKVSPDIEYPVIANFIAPAHVYRLVNIGNAIALLMESPFLRWRHNIALACGLRSSYAGIIPHMSISYEAQPDFVTAKAKQPDFRINLISEYTEPLKDKNK